MQAFHPSLWLKSLASVWFDRPRPARHRIRPTFRPRLEALEARLALNAYTVNVLGDTSGVAAGKSTGALSGDLRYCINAAITDISNNNQSNIIAFDANVFNAAKKINLDKTLDSDPTNFKVFSQTAFVLNNAANISITGSAAGVTIDGGGMVRLFAVEGASAKLTLIDLTLSGGLATGGAGANGGGGGLGAGGAVFDDGGSFTAVGCTFTNDAAKGGAGSGTAGGGGGGGLGGGDGSGANANGRHGGGANGAGSGNGTAGFGGGAGYGGLPGFGGGGGFGGHGGFGGGGSGANNTAVGFGSGGFGGGIGRNNLGGGGAGLGGGVFSNGGVLVLSNDTFTADSGTGGAGNQVGKGYGAAVFLVNGSLTATNDTFSLNTAADNGTDVYVLGDQTDSASRATALRSH